MSPRSVAIVYYVTVIIVCISILKYTRFHDLLLCSDRSDHQIYSYIMTIMTLYKNPYSYRCCSGHSDVVSCWYYCNSCNYCIPSTKATPQESRDPTRYSCFVHMYFLASPLILSTAAVYKEPYDGAVSRLPQTEHAMEECPANGVLTKINEGSLS